MLLSDIAVTSQRVTQTSSRLEKLRYLGGCLRRLAPDEIELGVAFLSGELRQGRIGIGPGLLREAMPGTAASSPGLGLLEVDAAFANIAATTGPGSSAERARLLGSLLGRATRDEQHFLARLVLGELRQGALEGVMAEAIGRASQVPAQDVRRAAMIAGDLPAVARAALSEGLAGLARFSIELLRPVQPMLARTADGVSDALARLGTVGLEYKLDGARVQVHKAGTEVRVFTRRLNDVTLAVPEIVETVRNLPVREIILDGEALALRADGTPHPFQTTMRRFGRRRDVARMRAVLPLRARFFDCLYLSGSSLISQAARARFEALEDTLPDEILIPRLVTGDAGAAEAFLREALRHGHEGIMAKSLDAPYEAGSRGSSWLKLKPAHTLDLVVLAAEWGHGRRSAWLSNLHLGARDPVSGGFVMLGKTFKGMTDEMLAWQTRRLLELEVARDAYTVHVRPELVVEVEFNEVQASPQYPAGLALRFARVKRYRPDKQPADADTVETVRGFHQGHPQGGAPT
jgi:ATP-dependent DNA ligase I